MAYFFASPVDVNIQLDGEELRKQVDTKGDKDKVTQCPVYYDGDSVGGQVRLWSCFAPKNSVFDTLTGDDTCTRWEEDDARGYQSRVRGHHRHVPVASRAPSFLHPFDVELFYDRGNHHEFLSLSQELASPGELRQAQMFEFLFKNVEKQFESYQGINVKLRSV